MTVTVRKSADPPPFLYAPPPAIQPPLSAYRIEYHIGVGARNGPSETSVGNANDMLIPDLLPRRLLKIAQLVLVQDLFKMFPLGI